MKTRDNKSSVVLLPSTGEEHEVLALARELLDEQPGEVEALRARLDALEQQPARTAAPRWRPMLVPLAAAAAIALAVLGVRLFVGGHSGNDTGPGPMMTVETTVGQSHTLEPVPGMTVELQPSSVLHVDPSAASVVVLTLDQGSIDVDYRHDNGGPMLHVLAGDVKVVVTGTHFTVTRDDDGIAVAVARGSVLVSWPDGEAVVENGGSWRSWANLTDALAGDAAANTEPQAPAPTEMEEPLAEAPVDAMETQPAPVDEPAVEEAAAAVEEPDDTQAQAMELYATIQVERGAGKPAAERLHNLDQFLEKYPSSEYAADILANRVEALSDLGADEEVLAAAAQYIQQYPDGARRGDVRWIEATVARGHLQDCGRAMAAYRELAQTRGRRQAQSSYYRGVCALEIDMRDEARNSLETAIELGLDDNLETHATKLLEDL